MTLCVMCVCVGMGYHTSVWLCNNGKVLVWLRKRSVLKEGPSCRAGRRNMIRTLPLHLISSQLPCLWSSALCCVCVCVCVCVVLVVCVRVLVGVCAVFHMLE